MAYISSTFNTSNTYVKYRLVVNLLSQDIVGNTSTVNVQLQAWRTNTGYTTYGSGTASVNVEGVQYNQGIASSQTITYNSYTVLYNDNHTIAHNADGTKSPSIGGYFSISAPVSGGWNYFTFSLPTIPRASQVFATNADIESSTSININRYSSSFTHTLKYTFGSLTGTIATAVETSYGWTIPTTFYAQIPNSKTGTCTITCETYSGATLIGTSTTTFTASVNEAANKPTISATISDSNTTTSTLTGNNQNMVKYFSNAAFSITATAKNSATIASRSITCGSLSSTVASGTLNAVESGTFVVSATDSRGISNSVTYSRTLVDYVRLTFNPVLYRTTPTGGGVSITFTGNYFNSTFGSVANQLGDTAGQYRIYWKYREKGTTTWSAETIINVTRSGNTFSNGVSPISLGTLFTYTKSYEFSFRVKDKLTTLDVPIQSVAQGIPVFDWNKTAFNVNVPTTVPTISASSVSASGNASVGGTLGVTGLTSIGSLSATGNISANGDLSVGGIITGTSPNLIAETTLSSSAANITLTGLDINAHGGVYEVIGSIVTASPADIWLLVNGNLGTNYRHDLWNQNGTWKQGVYSNETWGAFCGNSDSYGLGWFKILLYRANDYRIFLDITAQSGVAGSTVNRWVNGQFINTYQTNITSLKFYTLQGVNLNSASNIKVFRR